MHHRFVIICRRFVKTYRSHLQPSSSPVFMHCITLKNGTDRLFGNVVNCQFTLRNIPEKQKKKKSIYSATEE